MLINDVKKLINYVYSFTGVLASPNPGTGANTLNVLCEILFFLKIYGNPVDGGSFITPALEAMSVHKSLLRGKVLKGWVEDRIVSLPPEDIITVLESVTKSGAYAILRTFLNFLDNCGQLAVI